MNIRQHTEKLEKESLSPFAALSQNSKGRLVDEPECNIRTAYQRDRDRIIHSKAFRRLKHKTQVFISPEGDHYRTRLTHTLEVAQIARTIARALRLNEDLTEAISLGHDLGHTPFGHAGESALDDLSPHGFRHYEQSVRVVDKLEKSGRGLNLTQEVRNGIICHSKGAQAKTLEGRIVRIADKIAYINHDIEDAIRAGVLREDDIPEHISETMGNSSSDRISFLIRSLIENSQNNMIGFDPIVLDLFNELHSFMYEKVYLSPYAKREEKKVPMLISMLYDYYKDNYKKMPCDIQNIAHAEGIDRAVCDYIAGMSDDFVVQVFNNIFVPKSWTV